MKYKQLTEGCEAYNGNWWVVLDPAEGIPNIARWDEHQFGWINKYNEEECGVTHYLPDSNNVEIEKEPRQMTVYEWRKFPNVWFTFQPRPTFLYRKARWEGETLLDEHNVKFNIHTRALSAIGTEVVEE